MAFEIRAQVRIAPRWLWPSIACSLSPRDRLRRIASLRSRTTRFRSSRAASEGAVSEVTRASVAFGAPEKPITVPCCCKTLPSPTTSQDCHPSRLLRAVCTGHEAGKPSAGWRRVCSFRRQRRAPQGGRRRCGSSRPSSASHPRCGAQPVRQQVDDQGPVSLTHRPPPDARPRCRTLLPPALHDRPSHRVPLPTIVRRSVTKKADVRHFTNARGEGKLFSVELIDESSSEIRATFFGSAGERPPRGRALSEPLEGCRCPALPVAAQRCSRRRVPPFRVPRRSGQVLRAHPRTGRVLHVGGRGQAGQPQVHLHRQLVGDYFWRPHRGFVRASGRGTFSSLPDLSRAQRQLLGHFPD